MKVPFLLVTVAVAVTPMIAAAFLWPTTWSMIWRQVSISLWGIGVIFTIERLVGGRPTGQTPAALGAQLAHRGSTLGLGEFRTSLQIGLSPG
jgi:hypothetical protein